MRERSQLQTKPTPKPSFTPLQTGLLQRKCACGNSAGLTGKCSECQKKQIAQTEVYPESLALSRSAIASRFGHDFSQMQLHNNEVANGRTDDPIHQPLIDEFRRGEGLPLSGVDEFGQRVGPSEGEIKYTGLALPCPSRTEVDSTTDMTPGGLAAGFLSGYGIIAKMRVRPDARTWDGTRITESLTTSSSTCPPGLTQPGPCNGSSTFTVGQPSGGSAILPRQPGLINRFYDFHISRSRAVSFLHDSTRNPTGMNSCQTVCNQEYSCNGNVIGRHTITRNFRKGTHGGRDVTIIDVTKT